MEVPKTALVCAARHYVAAHESACAQIPVNFGKVCAECNYRWECGGDWITAAAPIFEAAGVHPQVFRPHEAADSSAHQDP